MLQLQDDLELHHGRRRLAADEALRLRLPQLALGGLNRRLRHLRAAGALLLRDGRERAGPRRPRSVVARPVARAPSPGGWEQPQPEHLGEEPPEQRGQAPDPPASPCLLMVLCIGGCRRRRRCGDAGGEVRHGERAAAGEHSGVELALEGGELVRVVEHAAAVPHEERAAATFVHRRLVIGRRHLYSFP